MRFHQGMITFAIATVMALGACGGDDDDGAAGATVGADGGDTGTGTGASTGSDDADASTGGDAADGTGVITIDGSDYTFTVEFCEGSTDQLARIAGPGTTPDGEPFWAEVRWGLGGPVTTQLGVGIEEVTSERGDPHWSNRLDDGQQYVNFDDGMAIVYEAPFRQAGNPGDPEVPGSVDASC